MVSITIVDTRDYSVLAKAICQSSAAAQLYAVAWFCAMVTPDIYHQVIQLERTAYTHITTYCEKPDGIQFTIEALIAKDE